MPSITIQPFDPPSRIHDLSDHLNSATCLVDSAYSSKYHRSGNFLDSDHCSPATAALQKVKTISGATSLDTRGTV
jgi:hypothetical protein